ncbi:MAG: asparaginase [Granulosicoccaceae bacterium]
MNPSLVNIWRGNAIESRHRGAVAVVNSSGRPLLALGDVQRPVFARSAIKFMQALPLIESGAADNFDLDERHIALACASHNAEPEHVQLIEQWLHRIACNVDHLECGAHMPMGADAQIALCASGRMPTRVHNNCSGKHTAMLSICKHLGEQTNNYRLYNHSAQRRWFEVLEALSSTRVTQLPWGYDGCGIPSIAVPLQRIGLALARFSNASNVIDDRRQAIERIKGALAAHPFLVAGSKRMCTELMSKHAPQVFVKVGAEGFYTAMLPERGLGVAIKIDDGNVRGAEVVLGVVLQKLGVLDNDAAKDLEQFISPSMTNSRGEVVGRAEPSSQWDSIVIE